MSAFKTILVPVSDADTGEPAVMTAFQVGRQFGSHAKVLHVRTDPTNAVPLVGEGMSGVMVEEMIAAAETQATQRAQAARAMFDRLCQTGAVALAVAPPAPEGLSAQWREITGREEDVIARCGRLYDLIVMTRPLPDSDQPSLLSINAALMESGRPLLLAPPAAPTSFGRRIAIAWNGSPEAARSVGYALPFLRQAAEVHILAAEETDDATLAPGEMATHLAWHGIRASFDALGRGGNTAEALLGAVNRMGADMLVMGAYTHSRLRQLIMGGVTRYMLHHANLPVLLSH